MAAYLWGWLKVTCGLSACTPGLALGPALSIFTFMWRVNSVTMTTSMTTAPSVSFVCVNHATLWYCRAVTCVCVTAVLITCATKPTTVRYVVPSSTRCYKFVPCDIKPCRPAVLQVYHVCRRRQSLAEHRCDHYVFLCTESQTFPEP